MQNLGDHRVASRRSVISRIQEGAVSLLSSATMLTDFLVIVLFYVVIGLIMLIIRKL